MFLYDTGGSSRCLELLGVSMIRHCCKKDLPDEVNGDDATLSSRALVKTKAKM